jgi:hypothetical protein
MSGQRTSSWARGSASTTASEHRWHGWRPALAIQVLLRRYPNLALGDEALTWQPTLISRALTRLPVRVG